MNKKRISCLVLFAVLTFSNNLMEGYAESNYIYSKDENEKDLVILSPQKEEQIISQKYKCIDPKILISGNPDIDKGILIQRNPGIDSHIFLNPNYETAESYSQESIINSVDPLTDQFSLYNK